MQRRFVLRTCLRAATQGTIQLAQFQTWLQLGGMHRHQARPNRLGFGEVSRLAQEATQVKGGLIIIGIQAQGLTVSRDGFINPVQSPEAFTKVVMPSAIPGVGLDGSTVTGQGGTGALPL